jgi:hypothetical protein
MKNEIILALLFLGAKHLVAQAPPTTGGAGGTNSNTFWARGGNTTSDGNVFGTRYNSPIYTYTGGIGDADRRLKLNGNFNAIGNQYSLNGYTFSNNNLGVNTSGYMLLGFGAGASAELYQNRGAFSLLHLNGRLGNFVQSEGYRPWMKTGITFTDNQDMSYMGLRQVGSGLDVTETVIAWTDNNVDNSVGPDDMVFRFATGGSGNTTINSDIRNATDLDGLHVSRYTAQGLMGLGNTFGANATGTPANLYSRPQSLMHLSYDRANGAANEQYGFMQMTYRENNSIVNVGNGETNNDGLRIGIDNDIQNNGANINFKHLNSYIRWQEASSIVVQTDSDNTAGGIEQSERLRITSKGAVQFNQGNTGSGLPNNLTRIGIAHDGATSLTKPMSLLHLGYNTGGVSSQIVNTANPIGWRNWMDLGMFISNRQNHLFLGLKPEGNGTTNNNPRMDAVLSWGDVSQKQNADYFRIIFSADKNDPTATENAYSKSESGSEMLRIYPGLDTIYTYNGGSSYQNLDTVYGKVGIGDFNSLADKNPTQKLDVIGNARLRFLPDSMFIADDNVKKIVMVDSNGVLRWTDNVSAGFAGCSDIEGGKLEENSKINLNDKNFYFSDNFSVYELDKNKVGVGYQCDEALPAKFNAKLDHTTNIKSTVGYFENSDFAAVTTPSATTINFIAIQGAVNQQQTYSSAVHYAGRFDASGARLNHGVYASATGNTRSIGARVIAEKSTSNNYGLYSEAKSDLLSSLNATNYASYFLASGPKKNYGVYSKAIQGDSNFGIYSYAVNSPTNFAGYFNGNLHYTGTLNGVSDEMFKTEIKRETNALEIMMKLNPVTYKLKVDDFSQFNFSNKLQHGFIAQEIGNLYPELIDQSFHPGEIDSLGNEIVAPLSYRSLNYTAITSINTAAIIELNKKVERATLSDVNLKTNIVELTNSLDKVLAMRGVKHEWDYTNYPEMTFDSAKHLGFIAQEINAIDADLTFTDANEFMHVEYDKIVPIVVESIEELNGKIESKDSIIDAQQNQINDLNSRLSQLESCLSALLPTLCNMNQQAIQQNSEQTQQAIQNQLQNKVQSELKISLSNANSLILTQNVPNPFAESTVIEYSVPATVAKAQIHFYNSEGKIINSVDIIERGNGKLTVFANDLSSGIYTYTLVADGKIVATKKMMKN